MAGCDPICDMDVDPVSSQPPFPACAEIRATAGTCGGCDVSVEIANKSCSTSILFTDFPIYACWSSLEGLEPNCPEIRVGQNGSAQFRLPQKGSFERGGMLEIDGVQYQIKITGTVHSLGDEGCSCSLRSRRSSIWGWAIAGVGLGTLGARYRGRRHRRACRTGRC